MSTFVKGKNKDDILSKSSEAAVVQLIYGGFAVQNSDYYEV